MKGKKETQDDLCRRDFIKTAAIGAGATVLHGIDAEGAKAESMAFVRIAGRDAAAEKSWS